MNDMNKKIQFIHVHLNKEDVNRAIQKWERGFSP